MTGILMTCSRSSSGIARGSTTTPGPRPRISSASSSACMSVWTPRRSVQAPLRRCSPSRRHASALRGSMGATARPGTRPGPRAGIGSTTCTRPRSSRNGFPQCARPANSGVPLHVLLNNNRSNYAVVNAFDFGAMLGLGLPRPPEPVIETLRERDGRVPDWVEAATPVATRCSRRRGGSGRSEKAGAS